MAIACGVARPSEATCWYMAQMDGSRRPHAAALASASDPAAPLAAAAPLAPLAPVAPLTPVALAAAAGPAGPNPAVPAVNSSPAHCFLNTPSTAGPPAAFGNSAVARLFQVISGTTASIRWS